MASRASTLDRNFSHVDAGGLEAQLAALSATSVPDQHGQFPEAGVELLWRLRLLHAPLPTALGGTALNKSASVLLDVLRAIGRHDLSLGRLFEGHVNAIQLAELHGTDDHLHALRREADHGRLSGVWNAETGVGVRLQADGGSHALCGRKVWASGAAHIRRPIVTASIGDPRGSIMVMPSLHGAQHADVSAWRAQGMRGSETGTVDFDGLGVDKSDIIGGPGDYYKSPHFSGGAWRVLAVQLGGLEQLYEQLRRQLTEGSRAASAHYRALLADGALALETARQWTRKAAAEAYSPAPSGDIDALVNLARTAFERSALVVIQSAQRALGLNAFMETNPIERLARDLSTYLRQPAPDRAIAQAVDWLLVSPTFGLEPLQK